MNNPYWVDTLSNEDKRKLADIDKPIQLHDDQEYILGRVKDIMFDNELLKDNLRQYQHWFDEYTRLKAWVEKKGLWEEYRDER